MFQLYVIGIIFIHKNKMNKYLKTLCWSFTPTLIIFLISGFANLNFNWFFTEFLSTNPTFRLFLLAVEATFFILILNYYSKKEFVQQHNKNNS